MLQKQTARAEKRDAIRKEYEDFYKENEIEYTEEDIHSEIVARLVGERLQSEKFLKRYAEKDASMIKRAAGFIKGLRKATKDTDEEAERITGEIMLRMDRALAGADVRESDGGKTSVKYYAVNDYDSEKAGIHDQIRASQEKLNQMSVVFSGQTPLKVGKAYEAGTWAIGELKRYGFQADRQNFGKVYFDETNIRDAMKYLDTDAEKVSIVAIYKVIKQGIQIGEHGNHKDRGKHTITFGAPVEINGVRGNMAVVVNMRNNQYKVHRILLPDGSIFKFYEKNTEQEMQRGVPKRSLANATSSVSNNSIPQKTDLSTPSAKKYDLKKKKAEGQEEVSESFKNAVARMYEKDAKQAQNTAEAFKEDNRVLNKKLEESRAETERYKAKGRSLARQIAQEAYETDVKTIRC